MDVAGDVVVGKARAFLAGISAVGFAGDRVYGVHARIAVQPPAEDLFIDGIALLRILRHGNKAVFQGQRLQIRIQRLLGGKQRALGLFEFLAVIPNQSREDDLARVHIHGNGQTILVKGIAVILAGIGEIRRTGVGIHAHVFRDLGALQIGPLIGEILLGKGVGRRLEIRGGKGRAILGEHTGLIGIKRNQCAGNRVDGNVQGVAFLVLHGRITIALSHLLRRQLPGIIQIGGKGSPVVIITGGGQFIFLRQTQLLHSPHPLIQFLRRQCAFIPGHALELHLRQLRVGRLIRHGGFPHRAVPGILLDKFFGIQNFAVAAAYHLAVQASEAIDQFGHLSVLHHLINGFHGNQALQLFQGGLLIHRGIGAGLCAVEGHVSVIAVIIGNRLRRQIHGEGKTDVRGIALIRQPALQIEAVVAITFQFAGNFRIVDPAFLAGKHPAQEFVGNGLHFALAGFGEPGVPAAGAAGKIIILIEIIAVNRAVRAAGNAQFRIVVGPVQIPAVAILTAGEIAVAIVDAQGSLRRQHHFRQLVADVLSKRRNTQRTQQRCRTDQRDDFLHFIHSLAMVLFF